MLCLPALLAAFLLAACDAAAPPALSEAEIVQAFEQLVQSPTRSGEMALSGSYRFLNAGPESGFALAGAFQFSGGDYAGSIQMRGGFGFGPENMDQQRVDIVLVAGQLFARTDGFGRWEVMQQEAGEVHRLVVRDPAASIDSAMFPGGAGLFGEDAAGDVRFDVYVDGRGVPLAATMVVDQRAGDEFGISFSMRYDYSNWGAEIEIRPPF